MRARPSKVALPQDAEVVLGVPGDHERERADGEPQPEATPVRESTSSPKLPNSRTFAARRWRSSSEMSSRERSSKVGARHELVLVHPGQRRGVAAGELERSEGHDSLDVQHVARTSFAVHLPGA